MVLDAWMQGYSYWETTIAAVCHQNKCFYCTHAPQSSGLLYKERDMGIYIAFSHWFLWSQAEFYTQLETEACTLYGKKCVFLEGKRDYMGTEQTRVLLLRSHHIPRTLLSLTSQLQQLSFLLSSVLFLTSILFPQLLPIHSTRSWVTSFFSPSLASLYKHALSKKKKISLNLATLKTWVLTSSAFFFFPS